MTATLTETDRSLEQVLANRRWAWRRSPFAHVVAWNVFRPRVYGDLVQAFQAFIQSDGALKYSDEHDFVGGPLTPDVAPPLDVFLSPTWHDVFGRLFGLDLIRHTSAGVHRHRPGSRSGFPHNDIKIERSAEGVDCVRAVALLFYLNSPEWRPGDGGGTGLYRHWSNPVDQPNIVIPPVDNSLLAFECSPYSYHAFLTNRRARDSIVVFLYRPLADFQAQWGPEGLSQYADG